MKACRAAVFHGPEKPFRLESLPLPELDLGEVLVRIRLATICQSDVHTWSGRRSVRTPLILGHEAIGTIVELGPEAPTAADGEALAIGDRVSWSIAASCDSCRACARGMPQKCELLYKYGHEPIERETGPGGGFAEFIVLRHGTTIIRVPESIPDAVACPANCATSTVRAILRAAGEVWQRAVLVQGCGMLGLTACAMARELGASVVIASDIVDERLELARGFGATELIDAGDESEFRSKILAMTEKRGVDVALELSGSSEAARFGLSVLDLGGRAIWAGAVFPGEPIAVNPESIVRGLTTIQGVHNYTPQDLVDAVKFLEETHEKYAFEELVGRQFGIEDIDEAFRVASGGTPRVAVRPSSRPI